MEKVKVAVSQIGSVVMDKNQCIKKLARSLHEIGKQGAKIAVFPEAFIPAYPRGMSFGTVVGSRSEEGRIDFQRYWENSIQIPGPEIMEISKAVKQAGVYAVVGVIERDSETSGGTLFCTVLFFAPNGELLGKHRKLKPTGSERLIWGQGDGSTMPVFETPYGKIGALICWENYMPLARAAMYAKGIQIYIAPTADSRDSWFCTMRHIAIEGRCFVLGCNQYSRKENYPDDIAQREEFKLLPDEMCRGGSCIVSPLGEFVVEPVIGEEKIIYAELDMNQIPQGQYDFDVTGHYNRPDIFQLIVNEKKQEGTVFEK